MRSKEADFTIFKKEFKKWQIKFGLTGYTVYFKYEPIDAYANITVNQKGMVATVRLDSSGEELEHRNVAKHAKHEAIHLLLWRLEDRASSRFILDSELCETVEDLVGRLEGLIQ